jgi:hypothetical protein
MPALHQNLDPKAICYGGFVYKGLQKYALFAITTALHRYHIAEVWIIK